MSLSEFFPGQIAYKWTYLLCYTSTRLTNLRMFLLFKLHFYFYMHFLYKKLSTVFPRIVVHAPMYETTLLFKVKNVLRIYKGAPLPVSYSAACTCKRNPKKLNH